ncbi:MAG TPA: triose-phosphate isomerase family protein [Candidatus Paceibacterota bacterium]|nr:triose-phosphate isomerase family protein [Candidatus Paceibacterota bacterium]
MKSLLIANWKMNPVSFKEAKHLLENTKKAADIAKSVSIVVAPPSIFLRELRGSYRGKKLSFAIQHAYFESTGSFTGEVSMAQAKDAGATYAIIGHAERRAMGETNDDTRRKVASALSLGLCPILCVGELKRTQDGEHFAFIKEQLKVGFADVPQTKIARMIIAYEPVWAIGASAAMDPRDMHEMAIFIRKMLVELYGEKGMVVCILYGGSIDETNAVEMLTRGDVSGLLVGRASADAAKLTALVRSIKNV